jgi:hypothetical protein
LIYHESRDEGLLAIDYLPHMMDIMTIVMPERRERTANAAVGTLNTAAISCFRRVSPANGVCNELIDQDNFNMGTVIDIKSQFLKTQIRVLSTSLAPSAEWRTRRESQDNLSDDVVRDVLQKREWIMIDTSFQSADNH